MESAAESGCHDTRKLSLARFVDLSRRRMRLTVEALAQRADVDLATLLAIESGEDVVPEPRTVFQLAKVLNVNPEPLMELAGLIDVKNSSVGEVATRFAARSEPMAALTPEEEEALNWFVDQISKR
jgi:transcriptional regulator with XRE-family HTH domain